VRGTRVVRGAHDDSFGFDSGFWIEGVVCDFLKVGKRGGLWEMAQREAKGLVGNEGDAGEASLFSERKHLGISEVLPVTSVWLFLADLKNEQGNLGEFEVIFLNSRATKFGLEESAKVFGQRAYFSCGVPEGAFARVFFIEIS